MSTTVDTEQQRNPNPKDIVDPSVDLNTSAETQQPAEVPEINPNLGSDSTHMGELEKDPPSEPIMDEVAVDRTAPQKQQSQTAQVDPIEASIRELAASNPLASAELLAKLRDTIPQYIEFDPAQDQEVENAELIRSITAAVRSVPGLEQGRIAMKFSRELDHVDIDKDGVPDLVHEFSDFVMVIDSPLGKAVVTADFDRSLEPGEDPIQVNLIEVRSDTEDLFFLSSQALSTVSEELEHISDLGGADTLTDSYLENVAESIRGSINEAFRAKGFEDMKADSRGKESSLHKELAGQELIRAGDVSIVVDDSKMSITVKDKYVFSYRYETNDEAVDLRSLTLRGVGQQNEEVLWAK